MYYFRNYSDTIFGYSMWLSYIASYLGCIRGILQYYMMNIVYTKCMYVTYVCILTNVPIAVLLMSVNDILMMVDDGILRESVARTCPLFSLITYVV